MKTSLLTLSVSLAALMLSACSKDTPNESPETAAPKASIDTIKTDPLVAETQTQSLDDVLAKQSDDVKARYDWRHPKETLEFFGLQPGMTVVETLPGGGWYTKIIADYLGKNGTLIGVNYQDALWPKFGMSEERVAERIAGIKKWATDVTEWVPNNAPHTEGYSFDNLPTSLDNTADMVLFIRALHNLSRFNDDGYLDAALESSFKALKPGGVLGIVQHATDSEVGVDGSRGYMNPKQLIDVITSAGFELVEETDINKNPNDAPTDEEIVWRLPPGLYTSKEDPEARARYQAIGESNRVTLKFVKPAA